MGIGVQELKHAAKLQEYSVSFGVSFPAIPFAFVAVLGWCCFIAANRNYRYLTS